MNPRDQIAQAMMMQQTPQIPGASLMPQMQSMPQMPAMGGMMGSASGMQQQPPFMQGAQQGAMQMGGAPGRIPPQQQMLGGATPMSFPGASATGLPDQSAQQMALSGAQGARRRYPGDELDPFFSATPQ
jgi:hypothetical protein